MEAANSSEITLSIYQPTLHHIPEDSFLQLLF
jgi:hypothetical protein